LGVVLLMIIGSVFLSCGKDTAGNPSPQKKTLLEKGVIKLPLNKISDGKAYYFRYTHSGKEIKYFVLKSSDGIIRAAFDACDVCWRAGLGYFQENDTMVCRNCGRRFSSNRINEVEGGCNPAPLKRTITKKNLEIKASDIIAGARYFNL